MSTSEIIHLHNKPYYRDEVLRFKSGLFDSCIDMAYVLTLEGSGRHDKFMKQLAIHMPSSKITVQYNKGYKDGKKKGVKTTATDITDALRNIFINAIEKGYARILVFEDDFFMDKSKYKAEDIKFICDFVKKNRMDIYNLGAFYCTDNIFSTFNDISKKHYSCGIGMYGAHAVIYSKSYMEVFIKDHATGVIEHCDDYWNNAKFLKYNYWKPIVFQTFPETANMQTWGKTKSDKWLIKTFSKPVIKSLKLDVSHEKFKFLRDIQRYGGMIGIITVGVVLIIILLVMVHRKNYKH